MTAKDLKNALLQEAVQGKLVPQIASEGNAKDLLEEIRKEKAKLVKEGKLKKEKPLPGITEEDIPFDIPENWCWCRWGDLSYSIQYGYNASAKEKGRIKMVRISDIHENEVIWESVPYCDINEDEIKTYLLKENDILFARTGGTVGKSFLVKDIPCEAIYAGYLIRTHYNSIKLVPEFLKLFMESDLYWSQLREGTIATAQPNCNGQTLSKMMIPLPPLAEQKRIVVAIEKFMPLIEEYGKKETELKAFNEQIGALTKKAILQEAVQGKLVPQIAAEGNARNLLEEIRKERLSHGFANSYGICGGKGKKSKNSDLRSKSQIRVTEISEDETPFEIPESWCWCRLGEIVPFGSCQNAEPSEIKDNDWILDLEDIEKDSGKIIAFKTKKQVDSKSTKHIFKEGYVLYSKLRPYLNKCVIAPKDGYCTSEILPLDFGDKIYNKYAQIYLMSPFFVDYTNSLSFGVKMPRLGTEDGKKALFPLPPLAEQKRIVAAIEKLLPLCEKLGE